MTNARVITITNLKGGSGKTSTAVPLACMAAKTGKTVLLDLDPTGSAAQWHAAAGLDDLFACQRITDEQLAPTLHQLNLQGDVQYVVLDTPPVAKEVTLQSMGEADLVLFPTHVGSGDLAQLVQTLGLLRLPLKANPALKYMVVLNHAGTMPAVTRETRQIVEEYGASVAVTEIPYRKTYIMAKGSRPTADWWHFEKLWHEVREALA